MARRPFLFIYFYSGPQHILEITLKWPAQIVSVKSIQNLARLPLLLNKLFSRGKDTNRLTAQIVTEFLFIGLWRIKTIQFHKKNVFVHFLLRVEVPFVNKSQVRLRQIALDLALNVAMWSDEGGTALIQLGQSSLANPKLFALSPDLISF